MELEGYGVDVTTKREAWLEAVEQCANMMVMDPYPGYRGEYFSMPCRNVVPKPVQKPHPPMWVACSNRETIKLAARLGLGALTFAFVDPSEARQWVDDYYRIFKEECVPIGHRGIPNICMVSGFSLHADASEAKRRGMDGFRFFGYALGHHYIFGEHKPGRTNIWAAFESVRAAMPEEGANRGIGTPDEVRAHLRGFYEIWPRCAGTRGSNPWSPRCGVASRRAGCRSETTLSSPFLAGDAAAPNPPGTTA